MKKFLWIVLFFGYGLLGSEVSEDYKKPPSCDVEVDSTANNDTSNNECCCDDVVRKGSSCKPDQKVINAESSALYSAIIAADNLFKTTYTAQPSMFAKQRVIVLTCMDFRIDLNGITGLGLADMYVLRNAGGRASDDMLRSLIIAQKLLGVEEIFLIQHTDCGMQKFTPKVMDALLEETVVTAKLVKNCNVTLYPLQDNNVCQWKNTSSCCGQNPCPAKKCIDWLTINHGLFESVLEDVKIIRANPFIPSNVPIYGFIFDVISGDLIPVPKAMEAGRAKPLSCNK